MVVSLGRHREVSPSRVKRFERSNGRQGRLGEEKEFGGKTITFTEFVPERKEGQGEDSTLSAIQNGTALIKTGRKGRKLANHSVRARPKNREGTPGVIKEPVLRVGIAGKIG